MNYFAKITILSMLILSAVKADTHTDLVLLNSEASSLNTELSSFTMNQEASCMNLGVINQSIEDFIITLENTMATMTTFSVTAEDLDSMDSISALIRNMGIESIRLSTELTGITTTADLFEYKAGLDAILQLSTDIGTMADRILEMADRILVMADNIGAMADRILITQQIQSANVALTQQSILTTQQNMVLLSDSFSTITYNLSLGLIMNDSNALAESMANITLTNTNMSSELENLAATTSATLVKVTDLMTWMMSESAKASNYINADTLTALGDLTTIHKALGTSLETYANTINSIAPLTDTVILSDATSAMLRLTKDIGVMSDRIMEMADKIFIMADNIGLMADEIVATQNIQMANVTLTQSSIVTTQNMMITIIKNFGL